MKKRSIHKLLILLVVILTSYSGNKAYAETVSQKTASNIAQQFFNAINGRITEAPKMVYNGRKLTTHRLFNPFYVYNSPAGGFVIISAENKAYPILAFSREGSFDPNYISDKMKALLSLYANHIEAIRYDSRMPLKAISAWGDIRNHIAGIISAPYDATDSRLSDDDLVDMLDTAISSDNVEEFVSYYYSPEEWTATIGSNLTPESTLAIGLISPTEVVPAEVVGRQGDFFRLRLDSPDRGLWRLLPTEYLSQGEVALLGNPKKVTPEIIPDDTFRFFEEFVEETQEAKSAVLREKELAVAPLEPIVQNMMGGHFMITLPENVRKADVFNVAGAKLATLTYRDTPVASIDISTEPAGFYIVMLESVTGNHYSFKLYR